MMHRRTALIGATVFIFIAIAMSLFLLPTSSGKLSSARLAAHRNATPSIASPFSSLSVPPNDATRRSIDLPQKVRRRVGLQHTWVRYVKSLLLPSVVSAATSSSSSSQQERVKVEQQLLSQRAAYTRVTSLLLPLATSLHGVATLADEEEDWAVTFVELLCAEWMLQDGAGIASDVADCRNVTHPCRHADATNKGCDEWEHLAGSYCRSSSFADEVKRRGPSVEGTAMRYIGRCSQADFANAEDVFAYGGKCAFTASVGEPSPEDAVLLTLVDVRLAQMHAIHQIGQLSVKDMQPVNSSAKTYEKGPLLVSVGVLCMVPKMRASIAFAATNGWMFRAGRSRFLWSMADVIDLQEDDRSISNGVVETKPPRAFPFSYRFNFHSKDDASRKSARAKAIYFNLTNVIVSSSGGHSSVQGLGVPAGRKKLDRIRDERFINIRKLSVHQRDPRLPDPRFVIRGHRPLYLFPIIFGSNNVGHVMFRYYSALDLFQRELYAAPEASVIGYVVMPSAELTFKERENMHRIFFDAFGPRWFSVFMANPAANIQESSIAADSSGLLDIIFEKAVVGFGRTYMFHPRHIHGIDRERALSQEALLPAMQHLRRATLQCFGWWSGTNATMYEDIDDLSLHSSGSEQQRDVPATQSPPRLLTISIIVRESRRLLNLDELVHAFEQNVKQPPLDVQTVMRAGRRTGIFIHKVRLETVTIRQQVSLAMQSDVLLGVAGTGLSWMMFMRPQSVVVEVQDPPIMRCAGSGINRERTYCDFSKQSTAGRLHHIGIPALKANPDECKADALRCDLNLTFEAFRGALLAAVCATAIRDEAIARERCSTYLAP